MKKLILYLSLLFFCLNSEFRNVVVLLDNGLAESIYNDLNKRAMPFLASTLHEAIKSETPIIVSGVVLHNFIKHYEPLEKTAKQIKQEIIESPRIRSYLAELDKDSKQLSVALSSLDIDIINRKQKADQDYLELKELAQSDPANYPLSYIAKRTKQIRFREKQDIDSLYDKVEKLKLAIKKDEEFIKSSIRIDTVAIASVKNVPLADVVLDDWKFYKHKNADLYLLLPKENLDFYLFGFNSYILKQFEYDDLKTNLKSTWEGKILGATISELSKHKIVIWPGFKIDINAVKDFFAPVAEEWNIFLSGHGMYKVEKFGLSFEERIAGLKHEELFGFMNFLASDIKTFSLYASTCFAGSTQAEILEQQLGMWEWNSKLKDSKPFNAYSVFIHSALDKEVFARNIDFDKYFVSLNQNADKIRSMYDKKLYSLDASYKDMFSKILTNVTSINTLYTIVMPLEEIIVSALPQIKLPGWSSFVPVPLIKDLLVITLDISLMGEVVNSQDKKVIVLATKYLQPKLVLNEQVKYIISILPGDSEIILESIEAKSFTKLEFEELFKKIQTPYTKKFVIKNLQTKDGTFSDLKIVVPANKS